MVEQRLNAFDEAYRMRERRMDVEGLLICPARVNVEQSRIERRLEGVDTQATGLGASKSEDVLDDLGNLVPLSGLRE